MSLRTPFRTLRGAAAAALAASALLACDEGDGPTAIEATGTVVGAAWVDVNGNAIFDTQDMPAQGVRVLLRLPAGAVTVASAQAGPNGLFDFDAPVGEYRAVVDPATVSDTLRLLRVDSADVTVSAGDTSVVLVGLAYPELSVAEARSADPDRRVMVDGVALNAWTTFGDSTVHVRGPGGALRAVRVLPSAAVAGDSVRLIGITGTLDGQPVLRNVFALVRASGGQSPAAVSVRTAVAAAADGGALDAELVQVHSAEILDLTTTSAGDSRLTVDDGSGPVGVILDRNIPFNLTFPGPVVGSLVDVTGLLVPDGSGAWLLKPRANGDVRVP